MKKKEDNIILLLILILFIIVIVFLMMNLDVITGKAIESDKIIIEKISSTSNNEDSYYAIDENKKTSWNSGVGFAKITLTLKEYYIIKSLKLECDGTKGGNKFNIKFYNLNDELILTKELFCDYFIGEVNYKIEPSIGTKKIEIIGESRGNNVNIRDINFN